ncbi:MAG: response regulator, partial [Acidobacteria bacterium]|nr:response regulator [Acidobacteriota bacterium]
MKEARILVVEDDDAQRRLVVDILRGAGYQVEGVTSAENALAELERRPLDLVLSDWKLPGMDGMGLLRQIHGEEREVAFVMVTAYGTIAQAVEAVRSGADDYL